MIYPCGRSRLFFDLNNTPNSVAEMLERKPPAAEGAKPRTTDFAKVVAKVRRTVERHEDQIARAFMLKDAPLCSIFIRMFDELSEGSSTTFALLEPIPCEYLRNEEVARVPLASFLRVRQATRSGHFLECHRAESVA